jgi:hypothetical protein
MDIINNPPKVGKHPEIDVQFAKWWLFLNSWGVAAFLLFLSCLGLNEHKHSCAVLSWLLLGWGYAVGRKEFPAFVARLRNEDSSRARVLEGTIWLEHLYKRPHQFFPLFLGVVMLGMLAVWPALNKNWGAYVSFFKL